VIAAVALASALSFGPSTEQQINRIVQPEIAARRAPGIAVGIVESGRIVYARGFGLAEIQRHIGVTPDTQFAVGQISEEFTAAAILLLEQSGKLNLDDPVTKYLPQVTVAKDVTVGQLLDQTSGLPHVSDWPHLVRAANAGKPVAPPGTRYDENPLNYMLAALIVQQIAGLPLSDYVEQNVFLQLVMNSSLYVGDTGVAPSHALGYTRRGGRFVPAQMWSATRTFGDSGVVSNIYDLAKWDIEFPILLREDAVRQMFTPGIPGSLDRHAMGWTIDQRGGKRFVWQIGEIPGYHAMNAVLPDDHVAVIVLVNTDTFGGPVTLPEQLAGRILDVLEPPSVQHVDNSVMTRARDWLGRLASGSIDRTQLTPAFSDYLTDQVVHQANLSSYGAVSSIIPIASVPASNGTTEYEFVVRFARGVLHYELTLTPDGKIAFISFTP
jgi:D-alanyl-D-alanine carboxypeptidase